MEVLAFVVIREAEGGEVNYSDKTDLLVYTEGLEARIANLEAENANLRAEIAQLKKGDTNE